MFRIELHDVSDAFVDCWRAAGRHLTQKLPPQHPFWLKTDLSGPFLEHLSFRLGNQLFYIRIEDADGHIDIPGSRKLLLRVADGSNGHACLLPMKRSGGGWRPVHSGWGLLDARTGTLVDPPALVTDKDIEMSDWEVHSFGIQVVSNYIKKRYFLDSCQTQIDPEIDPSIWFEGPEGPEFVVVRARHLRPPERPWTLPEITRKCAAQSRNGHYAPVRIFHEKQLMQLRPGRFPITPLWRGHGLNVSFSGLEPIVLQ